MVARYAGRSLPSSSAYGRTRRRCIRSGCRQSEAAHALQPEPSGLRPGASRNLRRGARAGRIDPRIKNPALDVLHYCTNITMKGFAEGLQGLGAPVRDKTGLTGRYDYTLSFTRAPAQWETVRLSPLKTVRRQTDQPRRTRTGRYRRSTPLGPNSGLKLVKVKALVPVLVIDHIDETPTPNKTKALSAAAPNQPATRSL